VAVAAPTFGSRRHIQATNHKEVQMKDLRSSWPLAVLLITGWIANHANGQEVFPGFPGRAVPIRGVIDVADEAKRQQQALEATLRQTLNSSLALRISELQRVCNLTPQQRKKFEVAAKGVVERAMENWNRQFEQLAQALPADAVIFEAAELAPPLEADQGAVAPGPGVKDDEPAPGAEQVADGGDGNQPQLLEVRIDPPDFVDEPLGAEIWRFQPIIRNLPRRHDAIPDSESVVRHGAEQHQIWVKALENILSVGQRELYETHRGGREAYRRRAMIQAIVAELDGTLLFTEQQREQVMAAIEKHGEELLTQPDGILVVDSLTLLHRVPDDFFAGLLTDDQLACVEELKKRELIQIQMDDDFELLEIEPEEPAAGIVPADKGDEDDHDGNR
jgi:hypothetical protein